MAHSLQLPTGNAHPNRRTCMLKQQTGLTDIYTIFFLHYPRHRPLQTAPQSAGLGFTTADNTTAHPQTLLSDLSSQTYRRQQQAARRRRRRSALPTFYFFYGYFCPKSFDIHCACVETQKAKYRKPFAKLNDY